MAGRAQRRKERRAFHPAPPPPPRHTKGHAAPPPASPSPSPSTLLSLRPPFGDFLSPPGAARGLLRDSLSPGRWAGGGRAEGGLPARSPPGPAPSSLSPLHWPQRLPALASPPPPGRARAAPGPALPLTPTGNIPETFLKRGGPAPPVPHPASTLGAGFSRRPPTLQRRFAP